MSYTNPAPDKKLLGPFASARSGDAAGWRTR